MLPHRKSSHVNGLCFAEKPRQERQVYPNAIAGVGVHRKTKFCIVVSDIASQGGNHENNVSSCGCCRDCIPHGLNASYSTAMGIPAASPGSSPWVGKSSVSSNSPSETSGCSSVRLVPGHRIDQPVRHPSPRTMPSSSAERTVNSRPTPGGRL